MGSGCNDASVYGKAISVSNEIFKVGLKMGHNMYVLDIGGGFPGQNTNHMSFDKVCRSILVF